MKKVIPVWQVDAFAVRPFEGNPAAVCVLDAYPADAWLLNVAQEMNLSETAFLVRGDATNQFHLRWFTPAAEVDLCGHATLASVKTLVSQRLVGDDSPIHFLTRSGELTCTTEGELITLDFPAIAISGEASAELAQETRAALGLKEGIVLQSKYDLLVLADTESRVRQLTPDFGRLKQIAARGVIVSAVSTGVEHDFVSRFFAPQHNIDEDPVTGSAHCCLAPYWAEKLGKLTLTGYQASHRGGVVRCRVVDDRVLLTGTAVTVLQGELHL